MGSPYTPAVLNQQLSGLDFLNFFVWEKGFSIFAILISDSDGPAVQAAATGR